MQEIFESNAISALILLVVIVVKLLEGNQESIL